MIDLSLKAIELRVPKDRERKIALSLSGIVLLLASGVYFIRFHLTPIPAGILGLIFSALVCMTVPLYNWAPMYMYRLLMLGAPGLVTGFILLFSEPGIIISGHAIRYQTPEISSTFMVLTTIALSSASLGWGLSLSRSRQKLERSKFYHPTNEKIRFIIYGLIVIVAGTFVANSAGPFVWVSAYTTQAKDPFLKIWAFNAFEFIGIIGMYCLLLFGKKLPKQYKIIFWLIVIYDLFFCNLLRGKRLETVAIVIACYLIKLEKKMVIIRPLKMIFLSCVLFFLIQTWGAYRFIADNGFSLGDSIVLAGQLVVDYQESEIKYFQIGTVGDIAATFYNTYGMLGENIIEPLYGKSYLDFLPRTLPEAIYPDRPEEMALMFEKYGETSGGGFFELAEAYINFGVIGVVLIPGILTYLFGKVYIQALIKRWPFYFLEYGLILCLFLRGTWYQNFTFYKVFVIWILVEVLIFIFTEWKIPNEAPLPASEKIQ